MSLWSFLGAGLPAGVLVWLLGKTFWQVALIVVVVVVVNSVGYAEGRRRA